MTSTAGALAQNHPKVSRIAPRGSGRLRGRKRHMWRELKLPGKRADQTTPAAAACSVKVSPSFFLRGPYLPRHVGGRGRDGHARGEAGRVLRPPISPRLGGSLRPALGASSSPHRPASGPAPHGRCPPYPARLTPLPLSSPPKPSTSLLPGSRILRNWNPVCQAGIGGAWGYQGRKAAAAPGGRAGLSGP